MSRRKMFFRMVTASLIRRRSRMIIALLAIAIGAAILTGLMTIYFDIPRQLGAEFRNYGANMIITPTDENITNDEMQEATGLIDADSLVGAAPYRYETVRIHEQPIMAAGTDMDQAQKTAPYWSVDGDWPSASGELMVGKNVSEDLGLKVGDSVEVSFQPEESAGAASTGSTSSSESAAAVSTSVSAVSESASAASTDASAASTSASAASTEAAAGSTSDSSDETTEDNVIEYTVTGILNTGGSEEDYVYMSMDDLDSLTGVGNTINLVELSISANSDQLNSYMNEINDQFPSMNAQLVKRVTASETTVLSKLQALILLVTVVVLALTMISVATTMMAVVTERRKEIGLRKAIGATDREIISEFMGEAMLLGGFGGLLGGILGFLFAQVVSISIFSSSISFRPLMLPIAIVVFIGVTCVACLIPIRSATRIDPALVLKGE